MAKAPHRAGHRTRLLVILSARASPRWAGPTGVPRERGSERPHRIGLALLEEQLAHTPC